MNNSIDFIPERDKELYEAYRKALWMKDVRSQEEAIRVAIRSRTSRFWISTFRAYRGILSIKKGKSRKGTRSIRQKMIEDIYERYKKLEERNEFRGSSTYFITSFAIYQEAPGFYISYSRALAIISRMNRERRNAR